MVGTKSTKIKYSVVYRIQKPASWQEVGRRTRFRYLVIRTREMLTLSQE